MPQIKSITIPEPCHENWQAMMLANSGRYCQSCCKVVMDFTAMSNDEVIKFLSSYTNICGRLNDRQLQGINKELFTNNTPVLRKWSIAAAIIGILPFTSFTVKAQTVNQQYVVPAQSGKNYVLGKVALIKKINGYVTDTVGKALPGATIAIVGSDQKTITDADGKFSITALDNADSLKISFIGYVLQYVAIKPNQGEMHIKLEEDKALVQGITGFMGAISIRRPLLWRVWYHVKKPFKSIF